eukprot:gene7776-10564_t
MKSRILISGLSALGSIETGYLSFQKLVNPNSLIACTLSGCNDVLNSPYSAVNIGNLHIPLTNIGFIAYSTVAILSILPFLKHQSNSPSDSNSISLLFLTTSMATFSLYLMFILTAVMQSSCTYCYVSALLSVSLATVAWNTNLVSNKTKAFVTAATATSISAISAVFLFYFTSVVTSPEPVQASTAPVAQYLANLEAEEALTKKSPPKITTISSPKAIQLAESLKLLNAKMYGAYWCSHCNNQKKIFGAEAFKSLEYIECDKEGENSKYKLCREKNIPGYPTWEIAGKYFPGEKDLNELEKMVTSLSK